MSQARSKALRVIAVLALLLLGVGWAQPAAVAFCPLSRDCAADLGVYPLPAEQTGHMPGHDMSGQAGHRHGQVESGQAAAPVSSASGCDDGQCMMQLCTQLPASASLHQVSFLPLPSLTYTAAPGGLSFSSLSVNGLFRPPRLLTTLLG